MRGPYSGGIRGRVVLPQFFLVLFRPTLLPPVESTSVHVVFGLYAERSNEVTPLCPIVAVANCRVRRTRNLPLVPLMQITCSVKNIK